MVQRLAGGPVEFLAAEVTSRLQLLFLGGHKDPDLIRLIKKMRRERRGPLANEIYLLYSIAKAQTKREGDFAEVGVYQGGSARAICEAKGDRRLRLFDTFSGLPEDSSAEDGGVLKKHTWACSRENVEKFLSKYPNISYHEGIFPGSVKGNTEVENTKFAFAHFDVDLYEGTLGCLQWFYPRMVPGGIIMTHDYSLLGGVKRAFDEFFADKPEGIIELPTTQCMVVKV
jgi:hypothetical protein